MKSVAQVSTVRPEGSTSPSMMEASSEKPSSPGWPTHTMASASYSPDMSGATSMGCEATSTTTTLAHFSFATLMVCFSFSDSAR